MTRIGLLSDTHGWLDKRIYEHFNQCDCIWHAGDIGSVEVLEQLQAFKPTRAVFGNIDGYDLRHRLPEIDRFKCEDVDVFITHIGGYPGNYDIRIRNKIYAMPPKLFISGHSHILKVKYDQQLKLLHLNPGAAGKQGFQLVQTIMRFAIDKDKIQDLEIIELKNML